MPWTEPKCNETAEVKSRSFAGDGYPVLCQRPEGHGGKWHRDGEVRWRVAKPVPETPAEPHLHTLQLRVTSRDGVDVDTLAVPLPCGIGGYRHVFSRQYLVDGTLISISGEVS